MYAPKCGHGPCAVADRRRAGLGGSARAAALHHGHVGVGLRRAQDRCAPAPLRGLWQPGGRRHHAQLRARQGHQGPQGERRRHSEPPSTSMSL